jgi:hypothetical protein
MLVEPKKLVQNSIGFKFDLSQDLKYRGSIKKLSRRDQKNQITFLENIQMTFKVCCNILSIAEKITFEGLYHLNIDIDYLSNRTNPDMNNLLAIDYSVRDWIDDTDLILPRMSEEFPRLAEDYK